MANDTSPLNEIDWNVPPENFKLFKSEVHLWRARLNLPLAKIEKLARIISPDEQQRANRFHFERDRQYFIAGRGILRIILQSYTRIKSHRLRFRYSAAGKPALANATTIAERLHFNLSHSHNLALYAVSYERLVGVDLEQIRLLEDAEKLAQRFFSIREYAFISTLPQECKQEAFFKFWTCKEAYLKAIGDGLAGGLDKVEVELRTNQQPVLLNIPGDSHQASHWSLFQLSPHPGYIATLAVKGQKRDWNLKCWDLPF